MTRKFLVGPAIRLMLQTDCETPAHLLRSPCCFPDQLCAESRKLSLRWDSHSRFERQCRTRDSVQRRESKAVTLWFACPMNPARHHRDARISQRKPNLARSRWMAAASASIEVEVF